MTASYSFPSGLRVLVVDDDDTTLKVVSTMLQKCSYRVSTATNGQDALKMLRDKNVADFDLVLSDVMMPDMDGFRLLELIGLELDLPVIMMSSNGDTQSVLRGVTHGAVDYLIKPVRLEELRNLWQHVVRRRRDLVKEESDDHSQEKDDGACENAKKRKDLGGGSNAQNDEDATASKKPRVVWSVDMHQQFVNAVNQLGVDKAVPKKILEIMKVDGLTRENVASHLQKYRLYLKRVSGVTPGTSGDGPGSGAASGSGGGAGGGGPGGDVGTGLAGSSLAGGSGGGKPAAASTAEGKLPEAKPSDRPGPAAEAAPSVPPPSASPPPGGLPGSMPGTPGMPGFPMPNPMLAAAMMHPSGNPHMGLGPGLGMHPMGMPGMPPGAGPMMPIPGMMPPMMPGMGGMPGLPPGMMPPPGMMGGFPGMPTSHGPAGPRGTPGTSPAVSPSGHAGPAPPQHPGIPPPATSSPMLVALPPDEAVGASGAGRGDALFGGAVNDHSDLAAAFTELYSGPNLAPFDDAHGGGVLGLGPDELLMAEEMAGGPHGGPAGGGGGGDDIDDLLNVFLKHEADM